MRDAFTLCDGNLGRGNLNPLINLNRVAVDDLAAQVQCQFNAQRALTRGRRTDNSDNGIERFACAHARENSMRYRITDQMRANRISAPMIWLREKRIGLAISKVEDFVYLQLKTGQHRRSEFNLA